MNRDSARALLVWMLLWVVAAGAGAAMLHYGRRLSWSGLAVPVGGFLTIQLALYGGIFLARKYRNLKMGSGIVGLCIWAQITWAGYYAWRWQLVPGLRKDELRAFSEIFLIFVVVLAFLPHRWIRRAAEIKCARCGHCHEGRDCTCGCRADQFKYPAFQPLA